ncbi:MAG: hypothetical protein KDC95_13855 [Planctomycetes bacterium]|nr:hypothetical protein [Planctomycetota bacterium]
MATKKKTKAGKPAAKTKSAAKKPASKASGRSVSKAKTAGASAKKTAKAKGVKAKTSASKSPAKSGSTTSSTSKKTATKKGKSVKTSSATVSRKAKAKTKKGQEKPAVEVIELEVVTPQKSGSKPSKKKSGRSKVEADTKVAANNDADDDDDNDNDGDGRRPARLRSQPVEVQEIDQRIDRERKSRLVPFTPRSYGKTPKKPKPSEIVDLLGKHMGKAPSLPEKQMPATVIELGIFCIFALGGNSAKASLDATNRLTSRFPVWNEFRVSEAYEFLEELEGISLSEAYDHCEQVLEFVNEVYKDQNDVDLEFLRDMTPDDRLVALNRYRSLGPALSQYLALALQNFEGVLFHYSWARPIQRVGIIDRSGSPKKLCASTEKSFGGLDTVTLQVDLIDLGEEICLPKAPNCKNCYLVLHCKSRKV